MSKTFVIVIGNPRRWICINNRLPLEFAAPKKDIYCSDDTRLRYATRGETFNEEHFQAVLHAKQLQLDTFPQSA